MTSQFSRVRFMSRILFGLVWTGGAICVMPATGQVINEDLKLLPSDGEFEDYFGHSIAIDSGVVVVGAYLDDDTGTDSGSAYLFDSVTGVQLAKLLSSDPRPMDIFGFAVGIDMSGGDGVVAVGAYGDDDIGEWSGSVYLFDAATGLQTAKLHASDGGFNGRFGFSISMDIGEMLIGAYLDTVGGINSGSAYLFDSFTGTQIGKITPSDGAAEDYFGFSVALDRKTGVMVVGAYRDDDNGSDSGSAYLYSSATGVLIAKLLPDDGSSGDLFGYAVAAGDGFVAVGAQRDDVTGTESGSVYLFDAATGAQLAKINPADGTNFDEFGISVAIDGGVLAVGAFRDSDTAAGSGSAYLYDLASGDQIAKLLASDGTPFQDFGRSIAINNGAVAVGARLDDDSAMDAGAGYLFTVPDGPCLADFTGDGTLDFFDVAAFLAAFSAGEAAGDFNGDGDFDFFDIAAFLDAFAAGCP
jgi:WD40 repeat protein